MHFFLNYDGHYLINIMIDNKSAHPFNPLIGLVKKEMEHTGQVV